MVYWRNDKKYGCFKKYRKQPERVVTARVTHGRLTYQDASNSRTIPTYARHGVGLRFARGVRGGRLAQCASLTAFAKHSGIVYNAYRLSDSLERAVRSDVRKVLAKDARDEAHNWNHASKQVEHEPSQRLDQPSNFRFNYNANWKSRASLREALQTSISSSNGLFENTDSVSALRTAGRNERWPVEPDQQVPFPADPPFEQISERILSALPHVTLRDDDATTYSQAATGLIASALYAKGFGNKTASTNISDVSDSAPVANEDVLQSFYKKTAELSSESPLFADADRSSWDANDIHLSNSLSEMNGSWLHNPTSIHSSRSSGFNELLSPFRVDGAVSLEKSQNSPFSLSNFESFDAQYGNVSRNDGASSVVSGEDGSFMQLLNDNDFKMSASNAGIPDSTQRIDDDRTFNCFTRNNFFDTEAVGNFNRFGFENEKSSSGSSWNSPVNDVFEGNIFSAVPESPDRLFFGSHDQLPETCNTRCACVVVLGARSHKAYKSKYASLCQANIECGVDS
ncbi:hypothetical protein Tcan_17358 [Toxocara canis]|uniref:Uncharacterized protein n=1 Tax=Toxocara canis TaxID=6265 RepID=A0A0B2UIG1_TOXCA|nr:hypothetical protein Tcan_17358 [Toxocara canis]